VIREAVMADIFTAIKTSFVLLSSSKQENYRSNYISAKVIMNVLILFSYPVTPLHGIS